jgi:hypothetical protein
MMVFGRRIVLDLATMSGIIERLSKRGLVSFSQGAADRRQLPRSSPKAASSSNVRSQRQNESAKLTVQKLTVGERLALHYLLGNIFTTEIDPASAGNGRVRSEEP